MNHHLTLLLLISLAGAVALLLWRSPAVTAARVANTIACLSVAVAVPLWFVYDPDNTAYQLVERVPLVPAWGMEYHVGIDGLSLLLALMTTVMVCVTVLASSAGDGHRPLGWVFALELGVLVACLALDLALFFVGWAITLIAVCCLGASRHQLSGRAWFQRWDVCLSLVSGAALLIGLLGLFAAHRAITGQSSFDITTYQQLVFDEGTQRWVFVALAVAFAACLALAIPGVGVFPRDRTPASMMALVLISAVAVKLGTYGLLRISLPILPDAARAFGPVLVGVSGVAMVVAAALAVARRQWGESIAYASVGQLALIAIGVLAANPVGVTGGALHQFNHGISIGGLCVAMSLLAGPSVTATSLGRRTPMVVLALGAAGLPMLSGFVSAFLVLQGVLTVSRVWALVAVGGLALVAAALLRVVLDLSRVRSDVDDAVAGTVHPGRVAGFACVPLAGLTIWAGLYPSPLLARLTTGVDRVVARVAPEYGQHAIAECGAPPSPELAKTNAAAAFLQAVPCGPDGKPLEGPALGLTTPAPQESR